ncbi:MAG: sensor histidine kinase [Rickettsiales bacterium]
MEFSIRRLYRNSVILVCLALLVLLSTAMTVVSALSMRNDESRALTTQASILALNLALTHERAATEATLATANANPLLVLACVTDTNNEVTDEIHGLAFDRVGASCQSLANAAPRFSEIRAVAPITEPNLPKARGRVMLVAVLPPIHNHLVRWIMVSAFLAVLLGIMCWQLGERMKRAMLKPIRQIATTAQRVTLYKDYSLRVVPGALALVPREIASLTDAFNAMLKEIEDRDGRLTRKTVELEASRRNAEAASHAKSQFLANVSHELRTPLNAIIGFSTMIESEQFGPVGDPKYKEYASDIHEAGRHLLDVINDILDLSKAEAGKLSVKFDALSLPKIVEKSLNIVAGQAQTKKIDIFTDMPSRLPKIIADRVRLMQIFLNLLSNAIKFTENGGKIVIRARAEAGKNEVYFFTIEIEDSGIGMEEIDISRVFSSFNQSDAGLNRKYEGAGLGLPLTKRLVELHHGKIRIESVKGRGTTVIVRLTSDPALLD